MATQTPTAPLPRRLLSTLGKRWRGWLRAIHRDIGYLAVGLTLIYAISGLAINHIDDWDPNYKSYERERMIAPIAADVPDDLALATARAALGVGAPRSTYRAGDELHLEYDYRKFVIYGDSGRVIEQGRRPRFLLRVANWLHYNRGKRAWTYIADAYAVMLLYLAISGLFMIKGRYGLRWRGLAGLTLGVAVPVAYVGWSGGPDAANRAAQARDAASAPEAPPPDDDDDDDDEFARPAPRRAPPLDAGPSGAPSPTVDAPAAEDDGDGGGELGGNPLAPTARQPSTPRRPRGRDDGGGELGGNPLAPR